jgi:hypothetical protein
LEKTIFLKIHVFGLKKNLFSWNNLTKLNDNCHKQ